MNVQYGLFYYFLNDNGKCDHCYYKVINDDNLPQVIKNIEEQAVKVSSKIWHIYHNGQTLEIELNYNQGYILSYKLI